MIYVLVESIQPRPVICLIGLGEHNGVQITAAVSPEDYAWAMQWKWRYKLDKRGKKYYAVRNARRSTRGPVPKWIQYDIYMHKAILVRMGREPPTPAHTIGDHGDGCSLNNQRPNLDWATGSHNCKTAKIKTPKCPHTGKFTRSA